MTCSTIYKSGSNAYHPAGTAVVFVTSGCCGDGYSKSPLHYVIALARFSCLGFYIKLLWPSSVCLPALWSAASFDLPTVCAL